MKELTYEEWQKNPTPRMMWCWDGNERDKRKRKVIYFIDNKDARYPIVALSPDTIISVGYQHYAEIERRMTNKELSRWLREKPTRECKWTYDDCICSAYGYREKYADEEVNKDIRIRENDGEWREPLVEVEE